MSETKKCIKCDEEKSLDKFVKNKRTKDGYTSVCKDCIDYKRRKKFRNKNAKWRFHYYKKEGLSIYEIADKYPNLFDPNYLEQVKEEYKEIVRKREKFAKYRKRIYVDVGEFPMTAEINSPYYILGEFVNAGFGYDLSIEEYFDAFIEPLIIVLDNMGIDEKIIKYSMSSCEEIFIELENERFFFDNDSFLKQSFKDGRPTISDVEDESVLKRLREILENAYWIYVDWTKEGD